MDQAWHEQVAMREQWEAENWTPETKQEYEEWAREQDSIPPWEVTYDDFLESQK